MHTPIFKRLESRLLNPPMNSLRRDLGASFRASHSKSGFSLVEMAVVIAMILVLAGAASLCIKPYLAYRDGQNASETLQTVKAARLMYLSDHPATDLANLTQDDLKPYMPNGAWPNPELPLVNGVSPTINFKGFQVTSSYQPPGSPANGLWSAGQ